MQRKESIGNEATSKETLEDLEENEATPTDNSDDGDVPSPDGAFDDPNQQQDAEP
jgi:hypothetical protein